MTSRLDLSQSRAVLIGTADYQDPAFLPLPAAGNSLVAMGQILTDPDLCGWPKDRVTLLKNRADVRKVVQTLRQLARGTSDVLLIYFVGHGVLLPSSRLCLVLTDTVAQDADVTGLDFGWVREAVIESPAKVKVVILDCCYSGRAIQALSADHGIADYTSIAGTYTLTASDLAAHVVPPEQQADQPTSFTGELTGLVREGIPGGPEQLTFGGIYPHLWQRLKARDLPEPNQRGTGMAGSFLFCRNRASEPAWSALRRETSRDPKDRPRPQRKRAGRLWFSFISLVCLAVAAFTVWMLSPGKAESGRTPTAYLASLEFSPYQYGNGLVVAREWILRGQQSGLLKEVTTVSSATGKALRVSFKEPTLQPIAKSWGSVRFGRLKPALVNGGRVLLWTLDVPARGTVALSYQVPVHVTGVAYGWLASRARQFQAMLTALDREGAHVVSLRSVQIRPARVTIRVGQSTPVTLSGLMSNGARARRSILSALRWRSANRAVAMVNSAGRVIGKAPGSTRIIVGSGNITASMVVIVAVGSEVTPSPNAGTSYSSPPPPAHHSPSPFPSPTTFTPKGI